VADSVISKWKPFPVFNPIEDIHTAAFNSVSVEFGTEDLVLQAAKTLLAKEIGYYPAIRKFARETALAMATISTQPTPIGKREIDVFHPYIVRETLLSSRKGLLGV